MLTRLGPRAFDSWVRRVAFPNQQPRSGLRLDQVDAYFQGQEYSYGESIGNVILPYHLPVELARNPTTAMLCDPGLRDRLRFVADEFRGHQGAWGMVSECFDDPAMRDDALQGVCVYTNARGISSADFDSTYGEELQALFDACGVTARPYLGCIDSYLRNASAEVDRTLSELLTGTDGWVIELDDDRPHVSAFSVERALSSGVSPVRRHVCEPVFVSRRPNPVLAEFDALLRPGVREADLERFLLAHFREIFGERYDRIESQLWLKFPALDIGGCDRRVDLFIRDSVSRDWELVEVKRLLPVAREYRGVPAFTAEITGAIRQLRNYKRILAQDAVKRELHAAGLDYWEPSLRLVVGRTPRSITHEQWRWLVSDEREVRVATFDELRSEAAARMEFRGRHLPD